MHTIISNNKRKTQTTTQSNTEKEQISGFKLDEHNVVREIKKQKRLWYPALTHTQERLQNTF